MSEYVYYLSGPITGVENYERKFLAAEQELVSRGYKVVNPAQLSKVLCNCDDFDTFMDVDMYLLSKCNVLVQLPGWEKSIGCNREYGYALARDMIVLKLEALLS